MYSFYFGDRRSPLLFVLAGAPALALALALAPALALALALAIVPLGFAIACFLALVRPLTYNKNKENPLL